MFPLTATPPHAAGPLTQIYYLLMPSVPLFMMLFGYIARMARAGMIEALTSDYTRTAVLKGLPLPAGDLAASCCATRCCRRSPSSRRRRGYLIGGLVVVETLFNYHGIGSLIFAAAKAKDFPMLAAGILVIGVVYVGANLIADLLYSALNPRISFGGRE